MAKLWLNFFQNRHPTLANELLNHLRFHIKNFSSIVRHLRIRTYASWPTSIAKIPSSYNKLVDCWTYRLENEHSREKFTLQILGNKAKTDVYEMRIYF